MPLYEYQCSTCAYRFERRQSFSDDAIKVCPECGGETRKVFHAPGIVFKGSGWYVTDSRSSTTAASAPLGDGASGEKSTTETKSDTKSEPKTETKSETKSESKGGESSGAKADASAA